MSGSTYPFGWVSDQSRAGVGDATSLRGATIDATQPADNDFLQYNSSNNRWENKSIAESLNITASDNQLIRYNATNSALQNTSILVDDSNNMTNVVNISSTGVVSTTNATASTSSSTGAIVASAGGLGVAGVVYTGSYINARNPDTGLASYFTNDFRRGTGAAAPAWIAAQFGANVVSGTSTGDRVIIGNYIGELTIGGHNDGHTAWRPLYIGNNTAGAGLTLRGIDIACTTTNGVSVSSTVEATSTTTGSIRTNGGLSVVKNVWIGGTSNFNGHLHTLGAAPTISATHTIQSWSTDTAGEITVAASSTATITFATGYTSAAGLSVVLTPKTAGAGDYYVGATSTTTFTVVNVVASPITFMYNVIACF